MIINPEIKGRFSPLLAPIGAAGYVVLENKDGGTIFFGMLQAGENGLQALARLRRKYPVDPDWTPTAARPAEQHFADAAPELVKCELIDEDGVLVGKTTPAQAFLEKMRQMQNLPVKSLPEMKADANELKGKGGAAKGS